MDLKTQKIATKMKIEVEVKFHDEDEWGIMLESYTEKTTFPPPLTVNEHDMIAATAFESNGISIWFKNRHHDHIPLTAKGNGNIVFSVYIRSFIDTIK